MSAVALNIHEFYNELKSAGFNEQQAEVIANIQGKTANAAIEKSQADIAQVKHEYRLDDITTNKDLDARIKETELKIELVRRDIKELELTINVRFKENETKIVNQLTAMQIEMQNTKITNRALLGVGALILGAVIKMAFFTH